MDLQTFLFGGAAGVILAVWLIKCCALWQDYCEALRNIAAARGRDHVKVPHWPDDTRSAA